MRKLSKHTNEQFIHRRNRRMNHGALPPRSPYLACALCKTGYWPKCQRIEYLVWRDAAIGTGDPELAVSIPAVPLSRIDFKQVAHTCPRPYSPSNINYGIGQERWRSEAGKVTAGLEENMAAFCWSWVTKPAGYVSEIGTGSYGPVDYVSTFAFTTMRRCKQTLNVGEKITKKNIFLKSG